MTLQMESLANNSEVNSSQILIEHPQFIRIEIDFSKQVVISLSYAMTMETLNVSWDEFPNVAKKIFRQLRSDTAFTDVTLVSEDLVHVRAEKE